MAVMTTFSAMDAALKVQKFLTDVARQSINADVFEANSDRMILANGESGATIPQSIYIKLDASVNDANSVKVPLMQELTAAPGTGLTSPVGTEENITFRYFTMYYNNVFKTVITQRYGIQSRDYLPYLGQKVDGALADLLGTYFKQVDGLYKRQALIETYSDNLTATPVSATAQFHPNWYLPTVAFGSQPTWVYTAATWATTLATAVHGLATDATTAGDVVYFQRLEAYARTVKHIKPVDLGDGTDGYCVVLPTPVATRLKSPAAVTGFTSLGQLFTTAAGFPPEMKLRWPGAIGKIGGLVFVEDARFPTLTVGGSSPNYTLTVNFAPLGLGSDGRDMSSTAFLVGFLLGQGAIYEWTPEPFHWEYNYEEYDRNVGAGLFKGTGYQAPVFIQTTSPQSSTTAQNFGSIALVFSNPSTF